MDKPKTPKAMTPKMFLHRASTTKLSAEGFLNQHKEFLLTGDLAELAAPVLIKVENKSLYPTPALDVIRGIVLSHLLAEQVWKDERAQERKGERESKATPKNWLASIYTKDGEIATRINAKGEVEDLQEGFHTSSQADGWVDRRLFDGASDWTGEVHHTSVVVNGEPFGWKVDRSTSISRTLKRPAPTATKNMAKKTSALGWGVKSSPSVSKFSRG